METFLSIRQFYLLTILLTKSFFIINLNIEIMYSNIYSWILELLMQL